MRPLIKKILRPVLKRAMRSAVIRAHGVRLLNRSPMLKLRVRNLYFGLLAVPTNTTPPSSVAAMVEVKTAGEPCLPPLPKQPANQYASPLESYSRQRGN